MKIDWNKKIGMQEENYGLTIFVGGLMQIVFGFSFGLIPLTIFIVSIIAFVLSLKYDRQEPFRRRMGFIGMSIVLVVALLYFISGWVGIIGSSVIAQTCFNVKINKNLKQPR